MPKASLSRLLMFCTGCGAENTLSALKQKYCRWCGMLILTNTEFSLDERVAQELARLREEDRQLTKLVAPHLTVV